jgi:hypothetical protein
MAPLANGKVIYIYRIIPSIRRIHIDTERIHIAQHIDTGTQKWILKRAALVKDVT